MRTVDVDIKSKPLRPTEGYFNEFSFLHGPDLKEWPIDRKEKSLAPAAFTLEDFLTIYFKRF